MFKNANYNYEEIWECQFHNMIETDIDLHDFCQSIKSNRDFFTERLLPRHCLYGGQVETSKL